MDVSRPSEASSRPFVIPASDPRRNWQSLPSAGKVPDWNPGLLRHSQVRYHWTVSYPVCKVWYCSGKMCILPTKCFGHKTLFFFYGWRLRQLREIVAVLNSWELMRNRTGEQLAQLSVLRGNSYLRLMQPHLHLLYEILSNLSKFTTKMQCWLDIIRFPRDPCHQENVYFSKI
jgi:hypothetical protein